MADVDREGLTRYVYRKLADPGFRKGLLAAADSTKPLTVAMPDDPARPLVARIARAGGTGNVVVPLANGFVVIGLVDVRAAEADATVDHPCGDVAWLRGDCTVGVFLARAMADEAADGPKRYGFKGRRRQPRQPGGQVKVVALAG